MHTFESSENLSKLVASTADLCFRPWIHSVINLSNNCIENQSTDSLDELILRIECRDLDGIRNHEHDIELELFRSGKDFNLVVGLIGIPNQPILWHGKHSVWMEGNSGKRCCAPNYGNEFESFARRLRALLIST